MVSSADTVFMFYLAVLFLLKIKWENWYTFLYTIRNTLYCAFDMIHFHAFIFLCLNVK